MAAPTVIEDVPGLTPKQRALCRRAGIFSAEQALLSPVAVLAKQLNTERAGANLIHRLAAVSLSSTSTSALHALFGQRDTFDERFRHHAVLSRAVQPASGPIASRLSGKQDRYQSFDTMRIGHMEIVCATQGADEPTQGNTNSSPRNGLDPDHLLAALKPTIPWAAITSAMRASKTSVVPDSQATFDACHDQDHALLPGPAGVEPELTPQASLTTMALGKRSPPADGPDSLPRQRRRLASPSDSEEDSGSEADAASTLDLKQSRPTLQSWQDSVSRLYLPTGDVRLDHILGGGLRRGSITEIVGESSSGKTQLALQIALHVILRLKSDLGSRPGDESAPAAGVAILTPQGAATASAMIQRVVDMADALPATQASRVDTQGQKRTHGPHVATVLRNLHVACLQDADALDHALAYTLPGLQRRLSRQGATGVGPLRLIVVENLPAFLQDDSADMNKFAGRLARARLLCSIADRLRCLCREPTYSTHRAAEDGGPEGGYRPAILVLNHVSDAFERETGIATAMLLDGHIPIHDLPLGLAAQPNQHDLPSTLSIAANAASEPSLAFDLQSSHSSGLISTIPTSVSAAGVRCHRDMAGQESAITVDDFARALKGRLKLAQLGNVWTNCLGTRVMLSRTFRRVPASIVPDRAHRTTHDKAQRRADLRVLAVRHAKVTFSAFAASGIGTNAQTDFVVTTGRGFLAIPDEQDLDRVSHTQAQQRREQRRKFELDVEGPQPHNEKDSRDLLDDSSTDFDYNEEEQLERLAFDVEMDAALASIPEDASSPGGSEANPPIPIDRPIISIGASGPAASQDLDS